VLNLESYGVGVVGEVATGVPLPSLPFVPLGTIPYLVLGGAGLMFLAVGESIGSARTFAARHRYEIDPDQELLALGAANLSAGMFGGFTSDASLSQSATAETAGAKSQLASLITAGLVLATAVFLAPLFQTLPTTVLGAIVIAGVVGLMDVDEMRRYWAWRRTDFLVAAAAMVGVLLTTVLAGMIAAVLLSVMFVLYRASRPYIAALGRMPGPGITFGDLARHPPAEPVPRLAIIRLDAPLYFFNANVARTQILALVNGYDPAPAGVIIDIAATADLDVTTTDMLFDLLTELRSRSIELLLAQVKGSVRDRLRRTGLMVALGEQRVFRTVPDAVADFHRRFPTRVAADRAGDAIAGPQATARPAPPEAD
jgi:SulP family sulfate permease